MPNTNNYSQELIKLLLPPEIFEYFEIVNLQVTDVSINVYLDENNVFPERFTEKKLISKGFHAVSIIQDFPIRDKSLYLHVRRRRWQDEGTGKVVSRDWDTVAKGTRYTKVFAVFLKGLLGYLPDKQ